MPFRFWLPWDKGSHGDIRQRGRTCSLNECVDSRGDTKRGAHSLGALAAPAEWQRVVSGSAGVALAQETSAPGGIRYSLAGPKRNEGERDRGLFCAGHHFSWNSAELL